MIAGLLLCPMFKFIDNSHTEWVKKDQIALKTSINGGCAKYNPKMPCVYKFEKLRTGSYLVSCGPETSTK